MDGDELVRHVRMRGGPASKVRIVALTAAAEPEKRAEFLAAGLDAVYTKPIDMIGLRHLIQVEGAAGASS
jgi:CheY-like chemotaxis protein